MEITKMLTISTAHVKPSTHKELIRASDPHFQSTCVFDYNIPFAVYRKGDYGFIIYITEDTMDRALMGELCPNDLTKVALYTVDHECNVLCLDADGEILPDLPNYKDLY